MASEDIEKDLIVEEYKSCRELIGRNIEIIERNEVYIIGACAAVFAFSIDRDDKWLSLGSAWLPTALTIIGSVRFNALSTTIDKIDKYLRSKEEHYKYIGFTTHYQDQPPISKLKSARWSVWVALGLVSFAFGVYRTDVAVTAQQKPKPAVATAHEAGSTVRKSD